MSGFDPSQWSYKYLIDVQPGHLIVVSVEGQGLVYAVRAFDESKPGEIAIALLCRNLPPLMSWIPRQGRGPAQACMTLGAPPRIEVDKPTSISLDRRLCEAGSVAIADGNICLVVGDADGKQVWVDLGTGQIRESQECWFATECRLGVSDIEGNFQEIYS